MGTLVATTQESLAEVADNAISLIGSVLPYALMIVGAVLVITIGIKVFKRIASK